MCGLIAMFSEEQYEEKLVKKSLEEMDYRGPDSSKCVTRKLGSLYITLGFNRLAIQDLSPAANQPFTLDGVTIIFNGEIYNTDTIKKCLLKRGVECFKTHSDTELLVRLYAVYGLNFLSMIKGMFAFIIIDFNKKEIVIARDRFGIKPLYFFRMDGMQIFASDIRTIAKVTDNKKVNYNYFYKHIILDPFVGYDNGTPFDGIYALTPGQYLVIDQEGVSKQFTYYDVSNIKIDNKKYTSADIKTKFVEAVNEHLVSDVPLGSTLSGGFDSSLISAVASQEGKNCNAFFTIDASKQQCSFSNDTEYSKLVYSKIKTSTTKHSLVKLNDSLDIRTIDLLVGALGAPLYDFSSIVWYEFYKAVKKHGITVLLNGQGADELWYGYYPKIWVWFSNLYGTNLSVSKVSDFYKGMRKNAVLSNAWNRHLNDKFHECVISVASELKSLSDEQDNDKKLTLHLLKHDLPSLLNFEDVFSMLNSLEVRVPFLDHELVEMALSIDSKTHLQNLYRGKDYLKAIFSDVLPGEVIDRDKSPTPKPNCDVEDLKTLFKDNITAILDSKLIRHLYRVEDVNNIVTSNNTSFYGGYIDALLQIISTWRFEKVFNI